MDPTTTIDRLLQHRDFVRSLASGLLRGEEGADDVAQEAMVAAVTRTPAPGVSARGWLTGITRNLSHRRVRERRRRARRERLAARPESVRSTVEVVEEEETRRRLVGAVLGLEEPYRTPILLRYYDGLPPRVIARRLGLPGATVRSHLRRGLERLRARLDERHGGRKAWASALVPLLRDAKTTWTGALLMTAKGKLVVAATLVVAALAGLFALQGEASGPAEADPGPAGLQVADTGPAQARRPEATAPGRTETIPSAPAPGPEVRVVAAEDETPLPGAVVEAVTEDGGTIRATADAGGRIAPSWSGRATLWASAVGRALQRFPDVELRSEDLVLRLPRGTGIVLRFEGDTGEPVPGPQARARYEEAGLPARTQVVPEESLTAGDTSAVLRMLFCSSEHWRRDVPWNWTAEGAALASPLAPGSWRLFLERPRTSPWLSQALDTEAGGERTLLVPLPTVRQRRVRLIAEESGAPLAGATVTPYPEFGDDRAYFRGTPRQADAHGELLLPVKDRHSGPLSGNRNWWVETATHAAKFNWIHQGEGVLEIRVPQRGNVEGRAWRRDGTPAVGLLVVWSQDGLVLRTTVDDDGSFRLRGVPAGTRNLALIEDMTDAVVRVSEGVTVPARGTVEIDLGTAVGARIRGRITAGGRGVPGLFVVLEPRQRAGDVTVGTTDTAGRYALEGIAPGSSALQVALGDIRASDDFRIRSAEPLPLMAGEERVLDFDLPGGTIAVRVVDAVTDKPIRGTVGARPAEREAERFPGYRWWPGWAALTDDNGETLLIGLPEGQLHRVSARAPDYEGASRDGVLPGSYDSPPQVVLRLRGRH